MSGYERSAPDQLRLGAEMTGKMITTHRRGHESVTVTSEVVKGNIVQRKQ